MKGRPANIIPSSRLELQIRADMRARLDIHLFSDVEGRVPKGAYAAFFDQRLREFFSEFDKVKK